MKIENRVIGDDNPCFIIAEIGANHNGNLKQAKELIDVARNAGADAVKFQSFTVENWISKEMTSFPTMDSSENIFDALKKCELSYSMYKKIKDYCEKIGIICFSTPSHIVDVDKLYKIGVPAFKFGSVQITDLPTIKYAASKGKPIILSVGASNLFEVFEAVEAVKSTGNEDIIILHCTIMYPTPMKYVNLNVIKTLKKTFPDIIVGYSDHTLDSTIIPVASVVMDAKVFEKHITLNRSMKGPDHKFALEPEEFKTMVKAIRDVEKALGSPIKKQLEKEKEIIFMGRRSLVAQKNIKKGTILKKNHITIKRPGYGIPPKFLELIIGRTTKKEITKDDVIKWGMI